MLNGPRDTRLYKMVRIVFGALLRLVFRMRITGTENVPPHGGVVLASNHLSNVDPLFLGLACPRQIRFMAKAELWRPALLGRLVTALGAFPVRRGEADREAVRQTLQLLSEGAVVGIFPEGHRQQEGMLGAPQPGAALFSLRPGVTTIPAAITGTNRLVRGRRISLPRITVAFGKPLDVHMPEATHSERHRQVVQRLMLAWAALLGQEWPSRGKDPA